MSGHIYVDATVVPLGANGQIVFRVTDSTNSKRLAFGTMDLRYRNGDTPQPIVPGMPLKIRIQSQPLDFVLPAGHGLNLSLMPSGEGYLAAPSAGPITFQPGDSSLVLPVIHRKASAFFTPVQWNGTANATAPQP
jgi:predicted acyl esterase